MFHVHDSSLMGSDSLKAVRQCVLVLYIGYVFVLISDADIYSKKKKDEQWNKREGWDALPVPVFFLS